MIQKIHFSAQQALPMVIGACLLALFVYSSPAGAINAISTPNPKPGSYGVEATKKQPAPTQAATITTPGNGASFSTSPITVNGICPNGLLVEVYNNGVMAGAVMCEGGSFTMQVSLFAGVNELSAIVYDELGQAGPVSNIVTINYTDTSFTAFGALITLTSSYARRSAPATSELGWPLQLSGGTGPYAFNIDWGDGSKPTLKSQPFAGVVAIAHTYKKAGVYPVNITVTDVNGVSAFLQLVAVSSGKVDTPVSAEAKRQETSTTKILWIPAAVCLILLVPAYWLGRQSQLTSLRNKMLKEHENQNK